MTHNQTNITIFSKDRPMQLHACLESLYKHFQSPSKPNVTVIFKASSKDFASGYQRTIKQFPADPHLDWVPEQNFRSQVIQAVQNKPSQFTMFLVDDIIFVSDVSTNDKQFGLVSNNKSMLGLSLRLHDGVTHCYATNEATPVPKFVKGVVWSWPGNQGDWGYPMSVDGNVFNTSLIKEFLETANFTNPNTLEVALDIRSKRPGTPSYQCCYPEAPKLINIPANRVQNVYRNRFADGLTPEEMNSLYLAGKTIDVTIFAGVKPNTVHVPLEFTFKE